MCIPLACRCCRQSQSYGRGWWRTVSHGISSFLCSKTIASHRSFLLVLNTVWSSCVGVLHNCVHVVLNGACLPRGVLCCSPAGAGGDVCGYTARRRGEASCEWLTCEGRLPAGSTRCHLATQKVTHVCSLRVSLLYASRAALLCLAFKWHPFSPAARRCNTVLSLCLSASSLA